MQTGFCDWSARYFAQPVMKVPCPAPRAQTACSPRLPGQRGSLSLAPLRAPGVWAPLLELTAQNPLGLFTGSRSRPLTVAPLAWVGPHRPRP